MPEYEAKFTESFASIIESTKRRDRDLAKALKDGVDSVLKNPMSHDGNLKGKVLSGRFKKYVGNKKYRIEYSVCWWCRNAAKTEQNGCEFCDETSKNTVVFFDGFPKKNRHDDYNG